MLVSAYFNDDQTQKAVDLLEHVVVVESQIFDEDDPDQQVSMDLITDA